MSCSGVRRGSISVGVIVATAGVLLVSAIAISTVVEVRGLKLRKDEIQAPGNAKLREIPKKFPSWEMIGTERQISAEAAEELGTANSMQRVYAQRGVPEGERGHAVDVHMAYYTGMVDTVPHVPERCNVGAGVQMIEAGRLVPVPIDMDLLTVNLDADPSVHGGEILQARSPIVHRRVNLPRGVEDLQMRVSSFRDSSGADFYAGYFFIANGGTVASADDVRLLAFGLEERYAYYCKVQFTSWTVGSAEELAEVAAGMLDEMFADIMLRLPDWVEVVEGRYPPEGGAGGGS